MAKKKMEVIDPEVLQAQNNEQRRFDGYRRNVDSSAVRRAAEGLVLAAKHQNLAQFDRIVEDVTERFDLENCYELERGVWNDALRLRKALI